MVGSWLRERDKGVIPTSRGKSGTSGHRGGRKEEPVEGEESAVGKEKSGVCEVDGTPCVAS